MKKYHLLILLLMPCLSQAQWQNGFKGDSTSATTAQTQLVLSSYATITGGSIVNAGTAGQVLYIGFNLNSSTAVPDTGAGKRIYLQAGSIWTPEKGFAAKIIWVRSKSGTVPYIYEIH